MGINLKEKREKVLVDASSAILLAKVGLGSLLCETYKVIMARSVFNEVTLHKRPGASGYLKQNEAGGILIEEVRQQVSTSLPERIHTLGTGEKDTLLLFYWGYGDFILTDDGAAAKFCRRNNIPFINALLFPLILEAAGMQHPRFRHYYCSKLEKTGRYSSKVLEFARSCTITSISFFLP